MGTTSRGYPFLSPSDSPDVAAATRALAEAVDADVSGIDSGLRFLTTLLYTSSGSFVLAQWPGLRAVRAYGVGGGGRGGNAGPTSSSQYAEGGGGGGGGYCESWIEVGALPSSVVVTIGAGGTGSSSGNGNAGAASSFGSFWSAGGGSGGLYGPPGSNWATPPAGGSGGVATGGNLRNMNGERGHHGQLLVATAGGEVRPSHRNHGGDSVLGRGGRSNTDTTSAGATGTGYGSGSAGARNGLSQSELGALTALSGVVYVDLWV